MGRKNKDHDYHSLPPYDEKLYEELVADGVSPFAAQLVASTEFEGVPTVRGEPHGRQAHCHAVDVGDVIRTDGQEEGQRVCETAIREQRIAIRKWEEANPNWNRRK